MNYTLNQLQIFLKIATLNSVTKAAEELNLTQPAVSIQLKNFQDQFEIPLTEVKGRKIFITEFGREIAKSAETILSQVNEINYKANAYKGLLSGKLKISVVSTGKYVMPFYLKSFLQKHKGIELDLEVTNKELVVKSLDNNEVDFSLVSQLPDNLELNNISLLPNKLYLVVNSLNNESNNYEEILANNSFIYRENGSGTRKLMEQFIKLYKLPSIQSLELSSNEAVKQAVIAGLGCSLMPLIGIKNELKNGALKIIPHPNLPIETTWRLVWLKEKNLSIVAEAYVNHLRLVAPEVKNDYFKWIENY